ASQRALSAQGKRAVAGQVLDQLRPATRACNHLVSTFHAQLTEQIADVLLDRGERNHQLGGDLLVAGASNQQAQDLLFTPREWLEQPCGLRLVGFGPDPISKRRSSLPSNPRKRCAPSFGQKERWGAGGLSLVRDPGP